MDQQLYYNAGWRTRGRFDRRSLGDSTPELDTLEAMMAYLDAQPRKADKFLTVYGYDSQDYHAARMYGPLYFDTDAEGNVPLALQEARAIVDLLTKKFPAHGIRVWFSGNKGFSIEVDATLCLAEPMEDLNLAYRRLAEDVCERLSLTTMDRVIYDRARLWRLPNTWNAKGEHYKIPLTLDHLRLLDADQIAEMAHKPVTDLEPAEPFTEEEIARGRQFIESVVALVQQELEAAGPGYDPSVLPKLPEEDIPCVQALLSDRLSEHEGRNNALWTLATFWRQQGLNPEEIADRVFTVNATYDPPMERGDVTTILRSVQRNQKRVGCRSPLLSERCGGRVNCPYFTQKLSTTADGIDLRQERRGYHAAIGDWALSVSHIQGKDGKLRAQIGATGPTGKKGMGTIDLLSALQVDRFAAIFPREERQGFREATALLAQELLSLQDRDLLAREETPLIKEEGGCYWAKRTARDGAVSYISISNFTIEVKRILKELTDTGDIMCVREILFHGVDGGVSRPHRARPRDLGLRSSFIEWCGGAGDYSFTGTDQDLQHLKEMYIFAATDVDEAYLVDHVGHVSIKPGLFLFGNVGVYHGERITPNEDGAFDIDGDRFQIKPLEYHEGSGAPTGLPHLEERALDLTGDRLAAGKRRLLSLLRANLFDYRGWLAMGLAYAALYLPELDGVYHSFPGLYAVGPMGSGKNTLVRWVMYALGAQASRPLNLPTTTIPALERSMAFYSGFPVILDEFRNSDRMEPKTEQMRNWYDRIGRSRAAGAGSQTITKPVRGWMVVAGQDIASDGALASRMIHLVMKSRTRSRDQAQKQEIDLLSLEVGPAIALEILQRKPTETASFLETVAEGQRYFQRRVEGIAMERLAYNYAVALAGWEAAFGDLVEPDEVEEFVEWCAYQAGQRHCEQAEMSEAATFLRDITSMIADRRILRGTHYTFEQNATVRTETGQEYIQNALFLWMGGIHPAWCEWKARSRTGQTFTATALTYALENEPYFVASKVVKWMGHTSHRCIVLDADKLDAVMPDEFNAS